MTPKELKSWMKAHKYTQQRLADTLSQWMDCTNVAVCRWCLPVKNGGNRAIPKHVEYFLKKIESGVDNVNS